MKVALLISGGVDSSVALHLLKEAGHEITAFYLKIWLEDELAFLGECPWEDDLEVVRAVCEQADIPLEVISMQKEYWDEVVKYTIEEVEAGRTPNPDMMCNQRIKFGRFYEKIDKSYEKVATGHYAQLEEDNGVAYLKRSPDPIKDQTYFLAHLSQEQLKRAMFPIGNYTKKEIRELAEKYDLPNKNRKDSQGICFLGKIKFSEFVKHHLGEKEGDFIEVETNEVIGKHQGFWYYTIGQRQGMGLSGGPWYVVRKDPAENVVFISRSYHTEDKIRNEFEVGALNWLSGYEPTVGGEVGRAVDEAAGEASVKTVDGNSVALSVKVRHGEQMYKAEVRFDGEDEVEMGGSVGGRAKGEVGAANLRANVKLEESDQGLAAGQFAVFYDGEICLGGGVIL
jgi:tRNA (5-methylaminomethyl-2-thiouridylate)-methyltransferase